jgi:hypothetical protein
MPVTGRRYRPVMGLFSRDPAKAEADRVKSESKARAVSDKARAKAEKKGVIVAGAVAVGHTFDNSADQFLIVFPDRVDLVNTGKMGSLLRSGAGTETIPVSRISSAECRNKGIWSVLEVHTSDTSITFKADLVSGPHLRQAVLDQVSAGAGRVDTGGAVPGGGASSAPDVMHQLQQLSELHQAGVLNDDEFAAKKAELLGRI